MRPRLVSLLLYELALAAERCLLLLRDFRSSVFQRSRIMSNDNRPVDLLSDAKGVYGIGILYDNLIDDEIRCHKHVILRPDIIAESDLRIKNREALLHTLPKHSFMLTHEWTLHEIMSAEALKRNPRYQELEHQEKGEEWWTGDRAKLYRKIRWGQHKRQLINLNGMLKRLIAEMLNLMPSSW